MWIDKKPKLNITMMREIGMAIEHNIICWLCDKNGAVYSAYPNFIFKPCWDCQKKFIGQWTKKNWWKKLFNQII